MKTTKCPTDAKKENYSTLAFLLAGDRPPPLRAPAGDPTQITPVKGMYSCKSRVSVETRELWLSTQECDFPGINIPSS